MSRFPTTALLDGITYLILTRSIFTSQDFASRTVYRRAGDLRINCHRSINVQRELSLRD